MRIPSGVTDQYIYFVAVDATDFVTRETALTTFTVYRSRNGGAAAVMTTPTINETDVTNMPGVYELLLNEDMTIDAGDDSQEMVFHITHAGMAAVTRTIELYRPKITAGNTFGVASDGDISGNLDGAVATLTGHTPQSGDTFARLGAPAGVSLSADLANIDGNVDAIKVKTDSLTFTLAGKVDANMDAISGDAAMAVNLMEGARGLVPASINGGAATTTSLPSNLPEPTDDHYNGRIITFTTGALAGQTTDITDYIGATKTMTVTSLTEAPADTDKFTIS